MLHNSASMQHLQMLQLAAHHASLNEMQAHQAAHHPTVGQHQPSVSQMHQPSMQLQPNAAMQHQAAVGLQHPVSLSQLQHPANMSQLAATSRSRPLCHHHAAPRHAQLAYRTP